MKYLILAGLLLTSVLGGYTYLNQGGIGGEGTINQLQQWKFDGTYLTQSVTDRVLKFTGLESAGDCLVTDASGVVSTSACGGGGSGTSTVYLATSTPWTNGNLAYVTGSGTVGSVATGTLTETATGLEFNATRALVGGSSILSLTTGYGIPLTASTTEWATAYASTTAMTPTYTRGLFSNTATGLTYTGATGITALTAGYNIPLSASTTNWNGLYDTPSTRITAGNGLAWTGNTLSATNTHNPITLSGALDYITLVGQDIVRGAIDLATDITGTLAVGNGGTGLTSTGASSTILSTNGTNPVWVGGNTLCVAITGSADLCDGGDATGGGGGGGDSVLSRTAGGLIYTPTTTDSVAIGRTSTTTNSKLEVNGTTTATVLVASSSIYSSSTASSTIANLMVSWFQVATDWVRGLFGSGLGRDENGDLAIVSRTDKRYNPQQITPTNHYSLDSGWSDWYLNGTTTHDATDYIDGTASMKIVTESDGSLTGMRLNITDVDMSNQTFGIWLKSDNWSNVAEANVLISTEGAFTSFYYLNAKTWLVSPANNEWIHLTFTLSDLIPSGSPDLATANDLIMRVIGVGGQTPTVWMDGFSTYDRTGASGGLVSITFDDANDSQFTTAEPYLDKYGYKGTFYIIPEEVNTGGSMTQTQVETLHNQGHEVAMHGATNLSTFSLADLQTELNEIKAYQIRYGFSDNFSYPNGAYNDQIREEVSKRFSSSRNISFLKNNPGYTDPYYINAVSMGSSTATSTLTGMIDEAIANDEWLILNFHDIVTSASAETQLNTSKYQAVIDYLNTTGVQVMPVEQVLARTYEREVMSHNITSATTVLTTFLTGVTDWLLNVSKVAITGKLFVATTTYNGATTTDALVIDGYTNSGEWTEAHCTNPMAETTQVGADTLRACGSGRYAYIEDTAGVIDFVQPTTGTSSYFRIRTGASGTTNAAGDGQGIGWASGIDFGDIQKWQPAMEWALRTDAMGNATSAIMVMGVTDKTGVSADFATESGQGIYVIASSTTANWQLACNPSSGGTTYVDTGIATTTVTSVSATTNNPFVHWRLEIGGTSNTAVTAVLKARTVSNKNFTQVGTCTINVSASTQLVAPTIGNGRVSAGTLSAELHLMWLKFWYKQSVF